MKKEQKESNKEITIIGIVREIEDNWKSCRVGIAAENGSYVVRMNEEGKNLQYEVGNKVEATGIILRTSSSYSGENRWPSGFWAPLWRSRPASAPWQPGPGASRPWCQ